MVVFGGSFGNGSSNNVWTFDFAASRWTQSNVQGPRPSPRYGQSQVLLDDEHILIVGGCGGPNMIFSDAWLLRMSELEPWQWSEVTVTNPHQSAPQLWSHPACKINNKLLVLSKALRSQSSHGAASTTGGTSVGTHRQMSCSSRGSLDAGGGGARQSSFVPPQGNLVPPRRKLLSSRSLDEKEPPPSPKSSAAGASNGGGAGGSGSGGGDRRIVELQRARSIPAIIVGEIPRLVVTKEDNSGDSTGSSDGAAVPIDRPRAGEPAPPQPQQRQQCIAMAASSLLPNQATLVEASVVMPPPPPPPAAGPSGGRSRPPFPSVRPNASADRNRQLEQLQRMEDYIRARATSQSSSSCSAVEGEEADGSEQQHQPATRMGSSSSAASSSATNSGSASPSSTSATPKMRFRPSSPPPRSKHRRPADFLCSRNPMNVYVLELDEAVSHKRVRWTVVEGAYDAPEDTILYSLVKGRAELIMFGGMRSSNPAEHQGLDVTPFTHTITNETFILRPPVRL